MLIQHCNKLLVKLRDSVSNAMKLLEEHECSYETASDKSLLPSVKKSGMVASGPAHSLSPDVMVNKFMTIAKSHELL